MKILGIDPGLGIVGYSVIDYDGETPVLLHSGSIQTQKGTREASRLLEIFEDTTTIVEKYNPDCAAIEKLFFFRNRTTVMPVAHARGVILTVLEKFHIPIYEYTPMEVKQVLTGYGRADKKKLNRWLNCRSGLMFCLSLTIPWILLRLQFVIRVQSCYDNFYEY